MRYENPLYLAEEAAALDLIADGHTALGVSFGAPEIAYKGWESFGYHSDERNGADLARTVIGREVSRVDQRLVIKPGWGIGKPHPGFPFCVCWHTLVGHYPCKTMRSSHNGSTLQGRGVNQSALRSEYVHATGRYCQEKASI